MDLNLLKTLNVQKDKKAMLKELYMFLYENSENMKAIFLKDYKYENNKFNKCMLGEGMMSFTYITDIFKLNKFEGYVVFDQYETEKVEKNV